jgi:O-antigen ligase
MNRVFAGAMMLIMALCVYGLALPLGGVNPEVAFPGYCAVALLAVLWAGWVWFGKDVSWVRSPMHLPVALFAIYALARYFGSPVEYDARQELFLVGACTLLYFITATYSYRPLDRTFFLIALMVLALFESAYGMWQAFTNSSWVFFWERPELYHGRASGTFIYPNQFASFLEMGLGLFLARAVYVSRESLSTERSVLLKVLTIYVVLMVVVALVLTRTRAAWFSATVGILIFALLGQWRRHFTWPRLGLVVLVAGVACAAILQFPSVKLRLERTFQFNERGSQALADRTLGGRTYMWKGTLQMIRDRPWFGSGVGSWQWVFQKYKDPRLNTHPEFAHNDILNLASDYGLLGLLLGGWVAVGFFRHARAAMRSATSPEQLAFAVGALVAVSTLLIHCWFDFSLHIPVNAVLLACILGMTAAMNAPSKGIERQVAPRLARYSTAFAVLLICGCGMWRLVPTTTAFRFTDLGNRLRGDLHYDAALEYYDRAIELDRNFAEPLVRIGDYNRTGALWRVGKDKTEERRAFAEAALTSYDRALRLNPYDSFVLVSRARMLDLLGREKDAVQGFERALTVDPGNAYAYFMFGCYYRDRGELQRAMELFKKSSDINFAFSAGLNTYDLEQLGIR